MMMPRSIDAGEKKPIEDRGPWGGQGGLRWDDGSYSTVRQVVITHAAGIDSIQIEYDEKGASILSEKHGGTGGNKTVELKLDYPHEFLTSLYGHYGSIKERGPVFIRSLTFESNKRTYGPYGVEQGTYFSFPMTGGKIVGFHGKSGGYLDAIGVHYLKPLQQQKISKAPVQSKTYMGNGSESVGYSVMQGSAGNGYEIVVAVTQKDDYGCPSPSQLSTQISQEYSDPGSNGKEISIEEVPSKAEGFVTFGPWGGTGGSLFDDGIYTGIRQIHLSRSVGIVSIRVQYDRAGQSVWGSKHGGTGGFKTDKIMFDYPYEILTHITGTYWPLMYTGPNIIKSLTFYTNKGQHGPFGEEQGPSFTTKPKEGKIVGFHGSEGFFLDAIGVHVIEGQLKPVKHCLSDAITQTEAGVAEIDNSPWFNKLVAAKRGPTEEVAWGPCGPGPWGGDGGRTWDDGVFTGIKQIFVTRSSEAICSIQIEYDRNGQSVWSVKHGGSGGTATHWVKLEYPHEELVCLSGYYGRIYRDERPKVVRSLTFYSNRGKYGPFGEENGTFFTSTTTEGKVVGLHGRSGVYLDAIGVHMQLAWKQQSFKASFFKFFS